MSPAPDSRSRSTDALWYRILDRYGLSTLYALLLLGYVLRQGEADARERRELLTRLATSIDAQTFALRELALEQRQHAAAVAPPRYLAPRLSVVQPPHADPPTSQE